MKIDSERRTRTAIFQLAKRSDGSSIITGHAAVFNSPADIGPFIEEIEPGFFAESLTRSDARALFNHDENYVLGRMSSSTLTVIEDNHGLSVNITPPITALIRDMVLAPMERGDLREMSFAWTTKPNGDRWDQMPGGKMKRTLLKGGCDQLYDVSVVTYPAYGDTDCSLAMRSFDKWRAGGGLPAGSPLMPAAAGNTARAQFEGAQRQADIDGLNRELQLNREREILIHNEHMCQLRRRIADLDAAERQLIEEQYERILYRALDNDAQGFRAKCDADLKVLLRMRTF